MTGEITLRGTVLPIGGLNEKAVAATAGGHQDRADSAGNEKDLVEIPDEVREDLEFILVENMDQVLEHALERPTQVAAAAGTECRRGGALRPLMSHARRRARGWIQSGACNDEGRLFTPGPVEIPVPHPARAVPGAAPPPHRRVPRHHAAACSETLRWLHGTEGEVFLLAASGTGAMEAAVVNLIAPGTRRWSPPAASSATAGSRCSRPTASPHEVIASEWGSGRRSAPRSNARSERDPSIATVFTTHSETSTGSDPRHRGARPDHPRARHVAWSSTASPASASIRCRRTRWGVDAVVCGSQKGLMMPARHRHR